VLRNQLRQSEDKVLLSMQLGRLQQHKKTLVQKLKQKMQNSSFNQLSLQGKTAVCSWAVLHKYLTKELLTNQSTFFLHNDNGDLIFDMERFNALPISGEAEHVKDYLSSYITQDPSSVTSVNAVTQRIGNGLDWQGIIQQADDFFALRHQQTSTDRTTLYNESRQDVQVLHEFASGQYLLVRLLTPAALKYEGREAHNCVGGGSYDKVAQSSDCGIYSVREVEEDGVLKPITTIEMRQGKFKQIYGVNNSMVPCLKMPVARDAVLFLSGKQAWADIVSDKSIPETAMQSLGIYRKPKSDIYIDVLHASLDSGFDLPDMKVQISQLKGFDWPHLMLGSIRVTGSVGQRQIPYIQDFKYAKRLQIEDIKGATHLDVGAFQRLQDLTIRSSENTVMALSGHSQTALDLHLHNITPYMTHLSGIHGLSLNQDNITFDLTLLSGCQELNLKASQQCQIKGISDNLQKLDVETGSFSEEQCFEAPNVQVLKMFVHRHDVALDVTRFPHLQTLHLFTKGQNIALQGSCSTLQELSLQGILTGDLDLHKFPALRRLSLFGMDLRNLAIRIPSNTQTVVHLQGCVITDKTMQQLRPAASVTFEGQNTAYGQCFDFSNCTDSLNIANFDFVNVDHLIFAPHLKEFTVLSSIPKPNRMLSGVLEEPTQHPSANEIKIEGLRQIDELHIGAATNVLQNLDPLSVHKIQYVNVIDTETLLDLRPMENVKECSLMVPNFEMLPVNLEKIELNCLMNNGKQHIDLRRFKKLKELSVNMGFAALETFKLPPQLQTLDIQCSAFANERLDLRSCSQLKTLKLRPGMTNLQHVYLPDSLEQIEAPYSSEDIAQYMFGSTTKNMVFTLAENSAQSVRGYLEKEWGKKHIQTDSALAKTNSVVLWSHYHQTLRRS
jgi:hypothetical protein